MSTRPTDAEFFLTMADMNVARGEGEAALDCARSAIEKGPTSAQASRLRALIEKIGTLADRGKRGELGAVSRELLAKLDAAPSPPEPAPVAAAAERPSTALDAVRELLVSPEIIARLREVVGSRERAPATGEISLPALEVLERVLGLDLDVSATAQLALDLLARATGAVRGVVVFAGRGGRHGLKSADEPPAETSRGIIAEVERTRSAVVVDDTSVDARFAARDSIQELALRSVLCVPAMTPQGELVASIYLDAPGARGRFGAREKALAESLARTLAPVLRNARRFDEQALDLARAKRSASRETPRRSLKLLGESAKMRELRALIDKVAPSQQTVLIEGESGTGKELVARAIQEKSERARRPFVAENTAALAEGVLEAELFGHVKGAFTGADRARPGLFRIADGGTLFLDEVGEMPEGLQRKLLRVLQEREVRPVGGADAIKVDVRVIAATHRDLDARIKDGQFRQDLFYRLAVLRVRVPALRERLEDLPLLFGEFVARAADEQGVAAPEISPALTKRLMAHPWPGNVRELEAFAARYVIEGASAELGRVEVPVADARVQVQLKLGEGEPPPLRDARLIFDKAYVGAILARHGGNVTAAAKALGFNRTYLSALLSRLGLRDAGPARGELNEGSGS